MHYLPLLILLALVSLLSVLIDRRRARKATAAPDTPAASQTTEPVVSATTASTGLLTRLTQQWSQRFGRKPTLPDDPVRDWLAAVFVENPAERVWFASLTPEQFKVLRSELTAFCAELGFDLVWLVEQASFKPAALEETGKTIVTHYCRAVRAAVLVHEDMQALQRYQAFLSNPTSKENLALGQQLYTRLVDAKLAPAATPELLMAEEKERQRFAVEAIQAAAAANDKAFSALLKTVVSRDSTARGVAAEPTQPARGNGAVATRSVAA
jgi:hypothetical protein